LQAFYITIIQIFEVFTISVYQRYLREIIIILFPQITQMYTEY